jgi:hypothetical protein
MKENVAFKIMLQCTRTAVIIILYTSKKMIGRMRESCVNITCGQNRGAL